MNSPEKDASSDENRTVEAPTLATREPAVHSDSTHRMLKNRHIQLIGIGGTIGTALFVQIGNGLIKGGPGSLWVAFILWCTVVLAVNNCLCEGQAIANPATANPEDTAEMVSWIPISSPFARFADHFVDPAFGFCAGVNNFALQAIGVPFEIVAFTLVLQFWTDKIPVVAIIFFVLFCYSFLNLFAVRYFGESEFWLSFGKVVLIVGLIIFTFITMVGGNPLRDVYGLRNWNPSKVAGAPFAEYITTGSLGRFHGFMAALSEATFTVAGPEYVSMAAGEAMHPRRNMPRAFKTVVYRLTGFFVLGSFCVGTVVPYNDPDLRNALLQAHPGAGSSPYAIAMKRLRIPVLPHIVNALILSSVFSAGNSYVFCGSRTLYGLALEGKAPKVLTKCTSSGVPVYCVGITLGIALISFLQVSNNSAIVLQWLVNLLTASQMLNYAIISFTYIRFHKALEAQGITRDTLPHKSLWQPFCAYYALVGTLTMAFLGGYTVFLPGKWNIPTFLFSYLSIALLSTLFVYYKVRHRTLWRQSEKTRLFEQEREEIDRYEEGLRTSAF